MNFSRILYLLIPICMLTFLGGMGCSLEEETSERPITCAADLKDDSMIIGVPVGAAASFVAEKNYDKSQLRYYNSLSEGYAAVKYGKIDAFLFDRHNMEFACLANTYLAVLPDDIAEEHIVVGLPLDQKELLDSINIFIENYQQTGLYDEMYKRWFESTNHEMPEIPLPEKTVGKIRIGTEGHNEPMNYFGKNGELTGFDIEFIRRFALEYQLEVDIKSMTYDALIVSTESGKIDMLVANLNHTPERSYKMLLSKDYVNSAITALVKKSRLTPKSKSIKKPSDLNHPNYIIGGESGTLAMRRVKEVIPQAKTLYYNVPPDLCIALKSRKIDAFAYDIPGIEYMMRVHADLMVLPDTIGKGQLSIAVNNNLKELHEQINLFIDQYQKDGTYKSMYQRWIRANTHTMPKIPKPTQPQGKLVVAVTPDYEPMCYMGKNQEIIGFDMEVAYRLALFLNREIEFKVANYEAIISLVASEKADIAIANIDVTPEREKTVLFSANYIDNSLGIVIRKSDYEQMSPNTSITTVKDLQGKRVASLTGGGFQELTDPFVSDVHYVFFNDNTSSVQALLLKKVDAVLLDEPVAKLYAAMYPETRIACVYATDNYGYAFRKESPLAKEASRVIQALKASGELSKLINKWCSADPSQKQITKWTHKPDFDGSKGTLRFATDPVLEPMVYTGKGGEIIGLDIEIVRRIAYELNMKFECVPTSFGALIESLTQEKVDIVGGAMSITENRKKVVDFAECYYVGGLTILTHNRPVEAHSKITSLDQLHDKRIGVLTGTIADEQAAIHFPKAIPLYVNTFNELILSLRAGKIDAFLSEEPMARSIMRLNPDITMLPQPLSASDYAFIFPKNEIQLCAEFSREIDKMRASGEIDLLAAMWIDSDISERKMPLLPTIQTHKTIKVATVPQLEPFTYLSEGQIVGYDLDVLYRIAHKLGYKIELSTMDWSGYLDAVMSGKVNMGIGSTSVTEERKKNVLFSSPNYRGGFVAMVLKEGATVEKPSNITQWLQTTYTSLSESFDRTFIHEDRWKLIADGLGVTIIITVFAAIFGSLLAFPICMMRRSPKRWIQLIAKGYIATLQGTPMLVILMILYYIIFAKVDVNAVLVAVIGFGLNFAAYVAEMLRTGIDGVPKGQFEAAQALGFGKFTAFRKIIFPQALRQVLPIYRGEFINMLKTTSIVGYIAIQDLTKMSDIIRSRTYEAFFPLIATAIIYFVIAHLMASFLAYIEYRIHPNTRNRMMKGVLKHD